MSTTTIRLPKELKERVANVAHNSGKSAHALILEAIARHVENEEMRNEFLETAENRFAHLVSSGESISWEQMRKYLEDRLHNKPTTPPTPRKFTSRQDGK